jgi:PAS domain-containing protein
MHKEKAAIQQVTKSMGIDTSLQDIANCIEDELLVIDREYRVKFANSAMRRRLPQNHAALPYGIVPLRRCSKMVAQRQLFTQTIPLI